MHGSSRISFAARKNVLVKDLEATVSRFPGNGVGLAQTDAVVIDGLPALLHYGKAGSTLGSSSFSSFLGKGPIGRVVCFATECCWERLTKLSFAGDVHFVGALELHEPVELA